MSNKIIIKKKKPLKAISLFSGMGGDSLAIHNQNINLVAYSEIDKTIQKTHALNFPNCELIGDGDILKTTDEELLKYKKDKVNLIFAGFPCQGFSNAGKKLPDDPRNTLFREFLRSTKLIKPNYIIGENVKGLLNRTTITQESIHDFYNSWGLGFINMECYELSQFISTIEEDSILNELKNVLTNTDYLHNKHYETTFDIEKLLKGWTFVKNELKLIQKKRKIHKTKDISEFDRDQETIYKQIDSIYTKLETNYIDIIKTEFETIGYDIYYQIIKCNQYGVPQNRERLIIVGIKKKLNQPFTFPEPSESTMDLRHIINFSMEGAIKVDQEDFDMASIPLECILKDMENDEGETNPHPNLKLLLKSKNYKYNGTIFPTRIHFGKRIPVGGEIIDIRKPINTIICTYARQPRFFIPQQNKNGYYLRCLLPEELKQIQGFPKDYKMFGDRNKQIIQIGNAVPPPVIEKILKQLI